MTLQDKRILPLRGRALDVWNAEEEYKQMKDWEVQENANTNVSYSNFMNFLYDKLLKRKDVLNIYLPSEAVEMYFNGDLHIHKLPHSLWIPYSFYGKDVIVIKRDNKIQLTTFEELFNSVNSDIEEIEGYEIKEPKKEIYILDKDGKWTLIKYVVRHKPKSKKLLVIHLNNGKILIVTKDHPVIVAPRITCEKCGSSDLTIIRTEKDYWRLLCNECGHRFKKELPKSDDFRVVKVEEVKKGDFMITQEIKLSYGERFVDKDLAYIYGYFLGDGSVIRRSSVPRGIQIKSLDNDNAEVLREKFGLVFEKVNVYDDSGLIIFRINSKELAKEFSDNFYVRRDEPISHNKKLPENILEYSRSAILALLAGFIDSDGAVKTDKYITRIYLRVNSFALLQMFQFILESLGFKTNLVYLPHTKRDESKISNKVLIAPHNPLFELSIYIPSSLSELKNYSVKLSKLQKIKYLSERVKRKTEIAKVSSIYEFEPEDMEYVYDIETESNTLIVNGVLTHNCAGWSMERILKNGLKTPNIISSPAKHFDTAVAHVANFFFMGAQEWTGAQAVSAFDLYVAPFVSHDNLDFKRVKQTLQGMLFELNYPARAGYQSPFTNITVVMDTSKDMLEGKAYVGGKEVGLLGDYVDEDLTINKALFELYLEGDSIGQPFTFPIPTLMLTKNFDWNGSRWDDLTDLIFEALARKGTAYLLNGYASNVEALYAMCLHPTEKILVKEDDYISYSTIGEIFERSAGKYLGKGWYEVKKKVYVASLNPKTYKIDWVRIKRFLKVKSKKMVIIKTIDGREVKTTVDHPYVVFTRDGLKIKLAKNIKKDDLVLVAKKSSIFDKNRQLILEDLGTVDNEFAFFIGLFIAEGNFLKMSKKSSSKYKKSKLINGRYYKGIQFTVNRKETRLVRWLVNFVYQRFGIVPKVKPDKRWKNTLYVLIYSNKLATALLRNNIGEKSSTKRIPWFIWNSPTEVIRAFINGLFEGDGYGKDLELHINNEELAKEVSLLLNMIGMPATIRFRESSQTIRISHIRGRSSKRKQYIKDTIFNRVPRYLVQTKRGMDYHNGLYSVITLVKHSALTDEIDRIIKSDFSLIPVSDVNIVELDSEQEFIDIELEKNHLFVHSMGTITHNCCRLTIDTSKISKQTFSLKISPEMIKNNGNKDEEIEEYLRSNRHAYGIWALPDATGSIGVVTLNMPRLAILSKGEWDIFEELLYYRMSHARDVLLAWRKRYEENLNAGFMPLTKIYLGHLRNHFNTFGIIGLPEAAANFMRNPLIWTEGTDKDMSEAVSIMKKMVSLVRKKAEELEQIDNYLYNVEEIPGESTGYRLAKIDSKMFKEEYLRGEILIPSDGTAPFYSNSIVPYYADVPIFKRAKWEGEVQQEFTGGVMMHIFLYESPDPKALKNLIYKIVTNTKVVYFSITPTIAVCRNCGWRAVGIFDKCPRCGGKVDLWSRIVGYYRPVKNWNIGKKAEFKLRAQYGSKGTVRAQ